MNYWLYAEPVGGGSEPVWMIYSEDAILAKCWERWMQAGRAYNLEHGLDEYSGVNPLRCIEDWITIHWAVPATAETLLNIISAPKPELI